MKAVGIRLVAVLLLLCGNSSVAATRLGRWCDNAAPSWAIILTLEVVDGGVTLIVKPVSPKGSEFRREVTERGNIFYKTDSPSGDRYRIVPGSGDLQLIDNDGLIRTAKRLRNEPQSGECELN
jgi:hypothetical protein